MIGKEPDLRATLPGVHQALLGAAHSFYATPLVNRGGNRLGALCLLFAHTHPLNESEQAQVAWYAEQAAQALDRTTAFEREHEVAVRLQRSLLSEPPARDRGRRADRPLQRRRRGPRDRRRLVRRRAALRRHRARHGRRRRRPRRDGGRADGPAAQRLPRARLRAHVARRACCGACCATSTRTRWRRRSASRSIRTRRSSPTRPPGIRRRCSSTATRAVVARLGHALAPPLGYVAARPRSARRPSSCPPAARSWPTPTDSSSAAAGASTPASTCWRRCVGASSSLGAEPLADRIFEEVAPHIGSLRRHRAADRPPARGAAAHGHRGAERSGGARRPAPAAAHAGSSCADWPRTSATTPSSPSARPATTRSSTPTATKPGFIHLLLEHREGTLAIRIADRGAWHPTTPSFERGRGIPLMRAVMDMTTIEHDERGTSVHAQPAAGLRHHPNGCADDAGASVVCGGRGSGGPSEHGATRWARSRSSSRPTHTAVVALVGEHDLALAPRPAGDADLCRRGPQRARRPQPLHVRRLRDHQPAARDAAHARRPTTAAAS